MVSETNERVYADLVSGLLGARTDPATERFDVELDAAVERGDVGAEVARRLRFWQRASLRALTDHTRSVLPTALGALDASRRDAEAYVDELLDALHEARPDDAPDDLEPDPVTSNDDVEHPAATPTEDPETPDTPDPASTVSVPRTISLEGPRPRLLVVGLVTTDPPTVRI